MKIDDDEHFALIEVLVKHYDGEDYGKTREEKDNYRIDLYQMSIKELIELYKEKYGADYEI